MREQSDWAQVRKSDRKQGESLAGFATCNTFPKWLVVDWGGGETDLQTTKVSCHSFMLGVNGENANPVIANALFTIEHDCGFSFFALV